MFVSESDPLQKSIIRASGLALLTIFLIKAFNTIYLVQPPGQPAEMLRLTHELLEHSPLLSIALVLLLLSLRDRIEAPGEQPRPLGIRDGLLVRARILVGVLALIYLMAIPVTLLQAQTVQNIGDRVLDRKAMIIRQQLQDVKGVINRPTASQPSLATLKQRYPWLGRAKVRSLDELQTLLNTTLKNEGPYYDRLRTTGRRDLRIQSLRICLLAGTYAALIGYLWHRWPRSMRPVGVAHSLHSQNLGVDLDDIGFPEDLGDSDMASRA
jgi:hypothetical protein